MSFRPTDDDEKLWNYVTRGAKKFLNNHVSKEKASDIKPSKNKSVEKHRINASASTNHSIKKEKAEEHPPQLNRRDAERLRKGQMQIDGTLDLHGLTQEQARQMLDKFVIQSLSKKYRCLLIVTGKGRLSKPSILKQQLPLWLETASYASNVLKLVQAHPRHGGSGAFYIYLKRT